MRPDTLKSVVWLVPLVPVLCLTVLGCSQKRETAASGGLACPQELRCEYRVDPLGIDERQPRLSWVLHSPRRGEVQTAYQVLAASSAALLAPGQADLWDSGQVNTAQSVQVVYAGKPLCAQMRCWWKVRVWDRSGQASPWSAPATWSMGLLEAADWKARWIGLDEAESPATQAAAGADEARRLPARMLRREFKVEKKVKQATAYVCGLGLFEFHLNGQKVGNHVLEPALTGYSKRALYVTFDVTEHLRPGANAVGVMLGNGRFFAPRSKVPVKTQTYGFPKLLFQLHIEYADGSAAEVLSDESWKLTTKGPIRANNEYDGEEYDARMAPAGWDQAGFADATWAKAQPVQGPPGVLAAQMIEPIRVTETLQPVAVTNPKPGVYIFDMGQNMVGWCRLKVRGPAGTVVTLRHAETIKDGLLYVDNLRSAKAKAVYILKGQGEEIYEPRFTYYGFRYVEVTGFPGKPELSSLAGRVVHDDLRPAGSFTCGHPLLNRIYQNIRWGVRGNYRSIPTDCPQRDERHGWLGDRSSESRGESYLYDVAALYEKWLADMRDAQSEKGEIPDVAPAYWPFYSNNVTWPSSFIIIPGMLYDQYADVRVLEKNFAGLCRWIDFMCGFLKDDLMPRDQYGDWCVPPESPELIHSKEPQRQTEKEVLGTTYFYHDLSLLVRYAEILGRPEPARKYRDLAERMKAAFNKKYFHADQAEYSNGSQTASVLPLAFGMVPPQHERAVFEKLVQKILVGTKGHIGTGLVGGQWLNRVLSDHGRADIVYKLATNKDYPSWGYMIEKNATTIWELWNGDTANPAMNSHNHVMLVGDLGIWLHEYLAGFRSDPQRPGFKHVIMRPHLVDGLPFAKATCRTMYGLLVSEWEIKGGDFHWHITVPVNATATVYIPARSAGEVSESGRPAETIEGVKFVNMQNGTAVFEVGSGNYQFISKGFRSGG